MRAMTWLAAAAAVATATVTTGLATVPAASAAAAPKLIIGTQTFGENVVLGYVYSDALKAAGISSTVKPNLGQRETIQPALAAGKITMTPEYLGSLLDYFAPSTGTLTVPQTAAALKPLLAKKTLVAANYSQAADADAIAVTQATATKYKLKSIADLKPYASKWTFGGPAECATRITCVPGLKKYYGVVFGHFKQLDEDGPLTVTALKNGSVQAARIFSSDITVKSDKFVVLADPKDFQGAGNIVPILSKASATPAVLKVLNKVSANLDTADLVSFNVAVAAKANPATIAQTFVSQNKL